jgi:hypothetical protein
VWEATAAFIHTCDVHNPVARKVAGDLNVADETGVDRYRAVPGIPIIAGIGNEKGAATDVEVVPGNIHPSKER